MKKLLLLTLVVVSLFLGFTAKAQTFKASSFLSGWSVIIPTNTTINFTDVNVPYASVVNSNLVFSSTNLFILATNLGTQYPTNQWWGNPQQTNTSQTFAAHFVDVPVFADKNGKVSDNYAISISVCGTNVSSTNVLNFTFVGLNYAGNMVQPTPSYGGVPGALLGATTTNSFQFPVLCIPNGVTPVNFRTNLPAAFLQGCGGLRLVKVVSGASAPPNFSSFLTSVALEGWVP